MDHALAGGARTHCRGVQAKLEEDNDKKDKSKKTPKEDKKVRVAIIGVGNCASAFVQGVYYYRDAKVKDNVPGIMHVNLGGYHIRDIEFTAAFDVP